MTDTMKPRSEFETGLASESGTHDAPRRPGRASLPCGDPPSVRAAAARGSWRGVFRELLGQPPLRVLDVGAGDGEVALLLDGLGHYLHGVDSDPERVRRSRKRADDGCAVAQFHVGDAEDLVFPAGVFDVVHARDVLGAVAHPEIALLECFRVLRPGGLVLVAESAPRTPPVEALRTAGFDHVAGVELELPRRFDASGRRTERWFRPWGAAQTPYRLAWGRRP